MKFLSTTSIIILAAALSGCATISEDECLAGNWGDLGYRDGVNGVSPDRITSYVERCAEFGVTPDRSAWLTSYETGLTYYCTYDKGLELGRSGNGYNAVCIGELADEFRAGYDDGRTYYQDKAYYDRLAADYGRVLDDLDAVRTELEDPDLTTDERRALQREEDNLQDERQDIRLAIREFERDHPEYLGEFIRDGEWN